MLINVDGDSVPLGLPLTRMSLISPHLCCPNHISSASMVFEQTDMVMTWLICPGSITATRASLSRFLQVTMQWRKILFKGKNVCIIYYLFSNRQTKAASEPYNSYILQIPKEEHLNVIHRAWTKKHFFIRKSYINLPHMTLLDDSRIF